ncbi:MAG: hypothetical protein LBN71_08955, partial [Tannerella sp.]|jgi:hypothetical protein|nr:hypothetical protein [Tannerella sp.]
LNVISPVGTKGDKAALLGPQGQPNILTGRNHAKPLAGIFYLKFVPSFEGNQAIQGVTAGMTEMLMQSHSGELSLLPSLPEQWKDGAISGLRARGGYDVDMAWNDGRRESGERYEIIPLNK